MKFIKLTEANNGEKKLLLNLHCLGTIQAGNKDNVYVRMTYQITDREGKLKTEYYFVKETFEEIEQMINGYTAPLNGA